MAKRKRLTPHQWDALREEYEQGATMAALAAKYGVTANTIGSRFRRKGLSARPRGPQQGAKLSRQQWAILRGEYEQGATIADCAAKFGAGEHAIRCYFRRHGLWVRLPAQGTKLTPEQWQQAAKDYQAGVAIWRLAKQHGVSKGLISLGLRRRGTKLRPPPYPAKHPQPTAWPERKADTITYDHDDEPRRREAAFLAQQLYGGGG